MGRHNHNGTGKFQSAEERHLEKLKWNVFLDERRKEDGKLLHFHLEKVTF